MFELEKILQYSILPSRVLVHCLGLFPGAICVPFIKTLMNFYVAEKR